MKNTNYNILLETILTKNLTEELISEPCVARKICVFMLVHVSQISDSYVY